MCYDYEQLQLRIFLNDLVSPPHLSREILVCVFLSHLSLFLQFPDAVFLNAVLDAEARKSTQTRASERKRAKTQVRNRRSVF